MSEENLSQIKEQVYKDPRPAEHFDRYHHRSRTTDPNWVYEAVRIATTLYAWIFFRTRGIAAEKVPARGPVILAPNHFSFMDHFFLGVSIRRKVRFMAKSQLFKPPMEWIYSPGGVFPVRRGFADEEAFITARSILERDGAIAMYSEGGRSRTGKLSDSRAAGDRPARAAVGRAGRADRDPRLLAGPQLEAPAVPEGDGAVRRPDPLGRGRRADARPAAGGGERDLRRGPQAVRAARRARAAAAWRPRGAASCGGRDGGPASRASSTASG